MTRIPRVLLLVAAILALGLGTAAQARAETPVQVVETFQGELLSVMQNAHLLSVRERYDRLKPAVEKAFHFPIMTSIATGNYWKSASTPQRTALVDAFKRNNVSTVATLFDGYSGEVFKTVDEREAPQNSRIVETHLESRDGSSVKLDYRLIDIDGRWWVIDVIVDDGISEMQVRKSEYRDILAKGGVDHLTEVLDAKVAELLAQ